MKSSLNFMSSFFNALPLPPGAQRVKECWRFLFFFLFVSRISSQVPSLRKHPFLLRSSPLGTFREGETDAFADYQVPLVVVVKVSQYNGFCFCDHKTHACTRSGQHQVMLPCYIMLPYCVMQQNMRRCSSDFVMAIREHK